MALSTKPQHSEICLPVVHHLTHCHPLDLAFHHEGYMPREAKTSTDVMILEITMCHISDPVAFAAHVYWLKNFDKDQHDNI